MAKKKRSSAPGSSAKDAAEPNNKSTSGGSVVPQSFEHLENPPLSSGVLDYVKAQGFERMTPVQAAAIPQFLSHKDVAVQACTGSGKTLAFLIPVVEFILKKKKPFKQQQIGGLILSPTRELAQQTHQVAKSLCASCNLSEPLLLVGGSSSSSSASTYRPVKSDLETFRRTGSDLVVGTPGRIEDILTRFAVMDCSELEYLILDEADVLLNMGFANTLQQILAKLPKMRRTGLFSATTATSTNSSLKEWMVRAGLRNPIWIDVAVTTTRKKKSSTDPSGESALSSSETTTQQATPSSLTNYYLVTSLDEKLSRLAAFLTDHRDEKIIVFFLTCACVEFYGNVLQRLLPQVNIESLHGKMVQKRREKTMQRFRGDSGGPAAGESPDDDNIPPGKHGQQAQESEQREGGALFCTDVAARGLDVSSVNWVVQFDAPQDPAFFVHRVGRSGRAGKQGSSLIFLTRKEEAYIDLLGMRKVPLLPLVDSERCCPPNDDDTELDDRKSDRKPAAKKGAASNDKSSARVIQSSKGDPIEDILPKVRDLVLTDRDFLEKGTKAFTSYIRAYKEHHCAFILRFASLDLGLLATSFCLLRLPKMPELRNALQKHNGRLPRFTPAGPDVDIFAIPFKDKAREAARQKRLQQELAAGGKSASLMKAEQRKAEKERKKKERRQAAVDKGRNPDKKRGRQAQLVDEWDELATEERLHKKLRKGKITKEQYDELVFGK